MSVWSRLRKARTGSKHQKADPSLSSSFTSVSTAPSTAPSTSAEAKLQEPTAPAPYRHIPTHAAHDALNGAPQLMKSAAERARSSPFNRRPSQRSSMTSSAGSSAGESSTLGYGSRMAWVSYPGGDRPVVPGRAVSFSAGQTSWHGRMSAVLHDVKIDYKGKGVDYSYMGPTIVTSDGGTTRSSTADVQPTPESPRYTTTPPWALDPPAPLSDLEQNNSSTSSFGSLSDTNSLRQTVTPPTPTFLPGHRRHSSSGAHRLHPRRRPRTASIPSPCDSPQTPIRTSTTNEKPIIPDTAAAGFVFGENVPSRPATATGSCIPRSPPRPGTADTGNAKRRPPVTLSGMRAKAVAQAAGTMYPLYPLQNTPQSSSRHTRTSSIGSRPGSATGTPFGITGYHQQILTETGHPMGNATTVSTGRPPSRSSVGSTSSFRKLRGFFHRSDRSSQLV